jgi:putative NADH-flavin reductase
MKIAVIGATGFVGTCIVNELANRNHQVLGISRKMQIQTEAIAFISLDIFNTNDLADALKTCDVVVSAYNPGWSNTPDIYDEFIEGSQSIQQAVKLAGIKRFIVVGGAGSLYIAAGIQLVDAYEFPPEIKAGAAAARDYLNMIRNETELDWAFFSPAKEMHQGITTGRTGKYRLGTDFPVVDEGGRSVLSVEDVAVVIADEIETPRHHRARFTAAY